MHPAFLAVLSQISSFIVSRLRAGDHVEEACLFANHAFSVVGTDSYAKKLATCEPETYVDVITADWKAEYLIRQAIYRGDEPYLFVEDDGQYSEMGMDLPEFMVRLAALGMAVGKEHVFYITEPMFERRGYSLSTLMTELVTEYRGLLQGLRHAGFTSSYSHKGRELRIAFHEITTGYYNDIAA